MCVGGDEFLEEIMTSNYKEKYLLLMMDLAKSLCVFVCICCFLPSAILKMDDE